MRWTIIVAAALATLGGWLPAQAADEGKTDHNAGPEDIAAWRQLKFGLFVHWGPVSLSGGEIGWARGGERRGTGGTGDIPVAVYDNLYRQFNPVKFDADQWVEIAKDAGMRYLVFTTRHHDGFSMFDSKLTDYKITSPESPYGRDVVRQLADACRRGGIKWGIYYSQPNWYHADYRTENHARFLQFMHGQVRELLTNYGQIDMIFFDGLGGTAQDWDAEPLFAMIRQLQPHVIVNDRCGVPADYSTPEQQIGRMQTNRPWETCMTICNQWAWKPGDRLKSLEECIQTLVKVVGGDGNLLFNVGPMPDGQIEPRQVERLRQMGQWLNQYGESIYGTRGGPFWRGAWGVSTHKDNRIYLHLLDPSQETTVLPPIEKKIVGHRVLTGGNATVRQTDESIELTVPPSARHPIDTIVVLELDGPAAEAHPSRADVESLALDKPAKASDVYQGAIDTYGAAKAVDDDQESRWATDGGTHEAWLEVDLGKPQQIGRAEIREACGPRVQKFELQTKQGDAWTTFASGTTIGENLTLEFNPVSAQVVRLNILSASEGPTLWDLQLLPPRKSSK